jgi:DNA-binding NarL/FixJ family response regulator
MPRSMKEKVRGLPPRLRQVVRLISLGCTIDEMAAVIGIQPRTIDNHKTRAYVALGVCKAAVVTRIAIKHRISSLNDRLTRSEKRRIASMI